MISPEENSDLGQTNKETDMEIAASVETIASMVSKIGNDPRLEDLHAKLSPESVSYLKEHNTPLPRPGLPTAEQAEQKDIKEISKIIEELHAKSVLSKEGGVYSLSPESIRYLLQNYIDISASGEHLAIHAIPEQLMDNAVIAKLQEAHRKNSAVELTQTESIAVKRLLENWRELDVQHTAA